MAVEIAARVFLALVSRAHFSFGVDHAGIPKIGLIRRYRPNLQSGGVELVHGDGAWRRRLVIVPVGTFDLRVAEALEYSSRVTAQEHRALHVATDEQDLESLGQEWMSRRPGVPLFTADNDGGVPATIAHVVRFELASGFEKRFANGTLRTAVTALRWR